MRTEIAETRFPTLNIIDAMWINAIPEGGPSASYGEATRVNIVSASVDPVTLDHWDAKHALLEAARIKGYSGLDSIDSENF